LLFLPIKLSPWRTVWFFGWVAQSASAWLIEWWMPGGRASRLEQF
jgi:hypothetical protein